MADNRKNTSYAVHGYRILNAITSASSRNWRKACQSAYAARWARKIMNLASEIFQLADTLLKKANQIDPAELEKLIMKHKGTSMKHK